MDEIEIKVDCDDALADAIRPFDYQFDGTSRFVLPEFKAPPRDKSWKIGLIVVLNGRQWRLMQVKN